MTTNIDELVKSTFELADRVVKDDSFELPAPVNTFIGEHLRDAAERINGLFSQIEQTLVSKGVSDEIVDTVFLEIRNSRRRSINDLLRLASELRDARIIVPTT